MRRHLDPKETQFFLDGEGEVQRCWKTWHHMDGQGYAGAAEPAAAPYGSDLSHPICAEGPPSADDPARQFAFACLARGRTLSKSKGVRYGLPLLVNPADLFG